jgi:hypothetical protein
MTGPADERVDEARRDPGGRQVGRQLPQLVAMPLALGPGQRRRDGAVLVGSTRDENAVDIRDHERLLVISHRTRLSAASVMTASTTASRAMAGHDMADLVSPTGVPQGTCMMMGSPRPRQDSALGSDVPAAAAGAP